MSGKRKYWKLDHFLRQIQSWLQCFLNLSAVVAYWGLQLLIQTPWMWHIDSLGSKLKKELFSVSEWPSFIKTWNVSQSDGKQTSWTGKEKKSLCIF